MTCPKHHRRRGVAKFVAHSRRVLSIATKYGWLPGARYTNLRDVRHLGWLGFLDIDWKHYSFERHFAAIEQMRPFMTVARDVTDRKNLDFCLHEAYLLAKFCEEVVVVPKDPVMGRQLHRLIPPEFVLGYSVPTRYGGTPIKPERFQGRVHLLGGRPDVQRALAESMNVVSVDCNRFTLDATFGDYFDGERFRPHPVGGYERCLHDSIVNINRLWRSYNGSEDIRDGRPKRR